MSLAEPLVMPETAAARRWLSIVGIGEDGVDGLSPTARGLRAQRGDRVRRQAPSRAGGAAHSRRGAAVAERRSSARSTRCSRSAAGRSACSPPAIRFIYGVGSLLARHVEPHEMLVLPAPSAFSLAAARLGWALPETTLRLAARPRARPCPPAPAAGRARARADLGRRRSRPRWRGLLADIGFGASRLTVLEALGGPRERVRTATAAHFDLGADRRPQHRGDRGGGGAGRAHHRARRRTARRAVRA